MGVFFHQWVGIIEAEQRRDQTAGVEVILVLTSGVQSLVVAERVGVRRLPEWLAVGEIARLLEYRPGVAHNCRVVPLIVRDIVAEFAEGVVETGRSIPSPIFGSVKGQYGESLFHLANIRNWGEFASNLMGILKKRTS